MKVCDLQKYCFNLTIMHKFLSFNKLDKIRYCLSIGKQQQCILCTYILHIISGIFLIHNQLNAIFHFLSISLLLFPLSFNYACTRMAHGRLLYQCDIYEWCIKLKQTWRNKLGTIQKDEVVYGSQGPSKKHKTLTILNKSELIGND